MESEERQCDSRDGNLPAVPSRKQRKSNRGFLLSHKPRESEEKQWEKEHGDVKVQHYFFLNCLVCTTVVLVNACC